MKTFVVKMSYELTLLLRVCLETAYPYTLHCSMSFYQILYPDQPDIFQDILYNTYIFQDVDQDTLSEVK